MKLSNAVFILFALLVAYSSVDAHHHILEIDTALPVLDIGKTFHMIEDTKNEYTIEDVMQLDDAFFTTSDLHELSFNHTFSSYWLKITLKNNTANELQYLLNVENADINQLKFYETQKGVIERSIITGEDYPFDNREIEHKGYIFYLSLSPQESKTYYLYAYSDGESIVLPIIIEDYETFYSHNTRTEHFSVFLYGMQFFIVLLNLFLWVLLRKSLYLKYAIYVLFAALSLAALQGFTNYYFWRNSPYFADMAGSFFSSISTLFLMFFVKDYFSIDRSQKVNFYIIRYFSIYLFFALLASFLPSPYKIVSYIATELGTVGSFVIVPLIAFRVCRKERFPALYVIISYVPLSLAVGSYFLRSIGMIQNTHILTGMDFSFTFQVLMLAFAVVASFRKEQKEILDTVVKQNREMTQLAIASNETDNSIGIFDSFGNIEWCNKEFENLYQIDFKNIGYNESVNIADLSMNQNILEYIEQCRETKSSIIFETEVVDAFGVVRWIQTTLSPVTDDDNALYNFVTIDSDLTNFKKSEEDNKRLQEQLVQSQKMETIGQLAGGIAHDFNNILTPIIGYTDMVMSDLPSNSKLKDDLKIVLEAASRAKKLVSQILTFSRNFQEETSVFHLRTILEEVLNLIKLSTPSNISIEYMDRSSERTIKADATQVQQIFMNLCTNAQQAIGEMDGTIEILLNEVKIDYSANKLLKTNLFDGEYFHVSIKDTGTGMSEEVLSKIFDPFYTTKEVGKGTGLGLSVVHGIIKKNKGDIVFESELGKGTTAHVYLPISIENKNEEIGNVVSVPRGNMEHILLVDDDIKVLNMLKRLLERNNYTVAAFSSCTEALVHFKATPAEFDLVLTDQTMPKMQGSDFLSEIRKIKPEIKSIILTGFSVNQEITKTENNVRSRVLYKPIEPATLLREIKQLILSEKNMNSRH